MAVEQQDDGQYGDLYEEEEDHEDPEEEEEEGDDQGEGGGGVGCGEVVVYSSDLPHYEAMMVLARPMPLEACNPRRGVEIMARTIYDLLGNNTICLATSRAAW